MFKSSAQHFSALVSFLVWMAWVPSIAQATCADGRPQQRETCAYLSMSGTITNQAAKADNLLISEIPALARKLTQKCLQAEQSGANQECWQSAAADARLFTLGVTGAAAEELKAMGEVWADLAQRLRRERASVAAQTPGPSTIEPVADSARPKDFSAQASSPRKKRKIAAKAGKPKRSAVAERQVQRASSPRVRKAQLKGTLGRKRYALAWRKEININKRRAKTRKTIAAESSLKCFFSPISCKP
jgi:hypothetical protein